MSTEFTSIRQAAFAWFRKNRGELNAEEAHFDAIECLDLLKALLIAVYSKVAGRGAERNGAEVKGTLMGALLAIDPKSAQRYMDDDVARRVKEGASEKAPDWYKKEVSALTALVKVSELVSTPKKRVPARRLRRDGTLETFAEAAARLIETAVKHENPLMSNKQFVKKEVINVLILGGAISLGKTKEEVKEKAKTFEGQPEPKPGTALYALMVANGDMKPVEADKKAADPVESDEDETNKGVGDKSKPAAKPGADANKPSGLAGAAASA